MKLAGTRLRNHPSRQGLTDPSSAGPVWNGTVRFNEQWLDQPQRWSRPRDIFVCAHGDLFHENVPDEWIDQVFAVMGESPWHRFQVLTKRARRMREYMTHPDVAQRIEATMSRLAHEGQIRHLDDRPSWPFRNVVMMVSAERQQEADERIEDLVLTPAHRRGLSLEPLLGSIGLSRWLQAGRCQSRGGGSVGAPFRCGLPRGHDGDHSALIETGSQWFGRGELHWIIVGGESGQSARPMHPEWVREIRDRALDAGVAFLFKQWGEFIDSVDSSNKDIVWIHPDGRIRSVSEVTGLEAPMFRAGKKAIGRRFDGMLHDGMPAP
jgi:protein gp37